jgi:sugar phosphate isomerase/epimerase
MAEFTLGYLTLDATPRETVEAAAVAGFSRCGVRLTPRSVEGRNVAADIAAADPDGLAIVARSAGVALSNVTCYQINRHLDADTMARVVDATYRAGAPILVVNAFDLAHDHVSDRYAKFCEIAENAKVRLAFEHIPYSAVRNLAAALDCVKRADSTSACLTLDLLHLCRSGDELSPLSGIPTDLIGLAQICDAPRVPIAEDHDALRQEAREGRLELGTGGLPINEFFHHVRNIADVEYEVPALAHRGLKPRDKALAARRDINNFLATCPAP